MQVLKLGGSILTSRADLCLFTEQYVRQIAPVLRSHLGSLVIAHGMGSYGRAFLPLYSEGRIPLSQAHLARIIQQNLRQFHELVLGQLIAAGLPVCSLDPEALFAVRDNKITFESMEIIAYQLDQGRVPVLYGGTVWDEARCFSILSSDQIVESVVLKLGAKRVVWATDVDGVFGRTSTHDDNVIPLLSSGNLYLMRRQASDEQDCTGGMTNKVRISLRLAQNGVPSIVINGKDFNKVAHALDGEPVYGTLICETSLQNSLEEGDSS